MQPPHGYRPVGLAPYVLALLLFPNARGIPVENAIRPIALGRKNWLFAGSETAGQRAANIVSLIQTAKANGHDPHAYLRDVLTRLPSHKNSRIGELLPHTWQPANAWPHHADSGDVDHVFLTMLTAALVLTSRRSEEMASAFVPASRPKPYWR